MTRDCAAQGQMESVTCNLCGGSHFERLYVVRSFNVVRCSACGLVFVNPRLVASELRRIYNAPDYYDRGYPDYKTKKMFIRWEAYPLLRNIRQFLGKPGGRILDVGCSFGFFMDVARQTGYEVQGIEVSEQASAFARDELGLDVRTWNLAEAQFDAGAFDVITMWDVLEHLTDPHASLDKMHHWLKPGGILALATPNIASPLARWTRGGWEQIKPEYHLYYFTPVTLQRICEAAGFSVLRLSTMGLGGTFNLITGGKPRPGDRRGLLANASRSKFLIKQIVGRFSEITRTGEKIYLYAGK